MKIALLLLVTFLTIKISLAQNSYNEHNISTNAWCAYSVIAIDVDNDGDIDALSSSECDDKIAWYENTGGVNFTEHIISTNADSAKGIFAIDFDIDGDIDVLSASQIDNKLAWYENDGSQNFTEHVISSNAMNAFSVFAIDVDNDGDIDVVSSTSSDYKLAWYENDGSQNFTEHIISNNSYDGHDIFVIDIDSDGDGDIISSPLNQKLAWYENDGSQNFTEHILIDNIISSSVFAIDLDNDNDIDIISVSDYNEITWFENDNNQGFTTNIITTTGSFFPKSIFAIDNENDNDIDILLGCEYGVLWLNNDGNQNFTEEFITEVQNTSSVFAININNNNNKIDILTARGMNVDLYENCLSKSEISVQICGNYTSPSGNYTWATSGIYTDTISNYAGCDSIITINLIAQQPNNQGICLVSVDPTTGKNKIVWEGNSNVGTESYVIQKALTSNNYTAIAIINENEPNEYIDYSSDPIAHSDFYKITIIDTCQSQSNIDSAVYHKTINLTLSNVGSTMSLNWEQYEVEDGSFVPSKYFIYRGTSSDNLQVIDSINGMLSSYNDIGVTQIYYYMVGAVRESCGVNTKSTNNTYSILSNKKDNKDIISVQELSGYLPLVIYPNPATNQIQIAGVENMQKGEITITDITGKTILQPSLRGTNATSQSVDISTLSPSTYFITIKADKVYRGKFVKEH